MIEAIQGFFDSQSWLANALGILIPIGTFAGMIWGAIKVLAQRPCIDRFVPASLQHQWSLENAKKIARIAIVDDQPSDFPVIDLKKDGYNITTHRQVQLSDISKLSQYDIVFLDMKGIVKDDPEYGGLKLIGELRRLNSNQKICAVSSKTFDPTATEFFKQADDTKRKPLTAQECKSVIDNFLPQILNLPILVDQANGSLKRLPRSTRLAIFNAFTHSGGKQKSSLDLENELLKIGLDQSSRFPLINIYRIINA